MIVKYRKAFFIDVEQMKKLEDIETVEFIADFAHNCHSPEEIPGFKWLRQYPGKARIEIAPHRIGVEVINDTIIFIRVIHRDLFNDIFP